LDWRSKLFVNLESVSYNGEARESSSVGDLCEAIN
jgi:hypothetical protein